MPKLNGVWKHICHLKSKKKYGYTFMLQPEAGNVACIGAFYAESTEKFGGLTSIASFNWSGYGKITGDVLSLIYKNEIDEGKCDLKIINGTHLKGKWRSKLRRDEGEEEYRKVHGLGFIAPFDPIFSERAVQNDYLVFILMPFAQEFLPIYEAIRQVAAQLNLRSLRADEIFGPGAIIRDIWKSILSSGIIIAELTGHNPNVFYELGLAHCLGKQVILISNSVDEIPFDLRHMRTVIYANAKELKEGLLGALESVLSQES